MSEPKTKTVAVITPIFPSFETEPIENGYAPSRLPQLLLEMFSKDRHPGEVRSLSGKLKLTREKHQMYFMGLRDAGLHSASRVYDMLCVTENVEVYFVRITETEKNA